MPEIIPKGMWFEELTPGLVVQHALRRTVTEADNVQFTVATMNPAPLHLDFAYAETTIWPPACEFNVHDRPHRWVVGA